METVNPPVPQNFSIKVLKILKLLWKAINVGLYVYMLSVMYKNIKINGVDYGQYVQPIASISPFIPFSLAFIVHYSIQNLERNQLNLQKIEQDVLKNVTSLINQNPFKLFFHYLWISFKAVLKQILFSFLLIIPVMILLGILQFIITGNGKIGATW